MPHASWASTRSFGSEMATGAALGEKCAITHTRALCGCWGGGTGPRLDVGVPRSCVVAHACRAGSFRAPPAVSGVWLRSLVAATGAASWPHGPCTPATVTTGCAHAAGTSMQSLGAGCRCNVWEQFPPPTFRPLSSAATFSRHSPPKCRTGEVSTRWQGSLTCPVETRAHFSNASVESV